jgi:hypothetical protein
MMMMVPLLRLPCNDGYDELSFFDVEVCCCWCGVGGGDDDVVDGSALTVMRFLFIFDGKVYIVYKILYTVFGKR